MLWLTLVALSLVKTRTAPCFPFTLFLRPLIAAGFCWGTEGIKGSFKAQRSQDLLCFSSQALTWLCLSLQVEQVLLMCVTDLAISVAHWKHGNFSLDVWMCVMCPIMGASRLHGGRLMEQIFTVLSSQIYVLHLQDIEVCFLRNTMHTCLTCRYNCMYAQIHATYTCAASSAHVNIPCMCVCSLQATLHINKTICIYCIKTCFMQTLLQVLQLFFFFVNPEIWLIWSTAKWTYFGNGKIVM